jgi:sugar phosphate isomerase/epimerase
MAGATDGGIDIHLEDRPMTQQERRRFIQASSAALALAATGTLTRPSFGVGSLPDGDRTSSVPKGENMQLGLVTYLWGKDWDLPTLLENCEKTNVLGLELRTQHAHGVEPSLSKRQRNEVRKRFADSPVTLLGYGSNAQFHENDPQKLKKNIELAKSYIELIHDCGGTGVKVKPNGFVKDVPQEKTIAQIGKALAEVADYGQNFGQQIRVEVHGKGTSLLPNIAVMMKVADHPNATVCWNCNAQDLEGDGLKANFKMVKQYFGDTVHVREMNVGTYPYQQLFDLFVEMDYAGWILLECRTKPQDPIAALKEQRELFAKLIARAQKTNSSSKAKRT